MTNYICYTLKAMEPLVFSRNTSQIDNQSPIDYIPGSSLRGAFINQYMIRNKLESDISADPKLRELLLSTTLRFAAGYPVRQGGRCLPLPSNLLVRKQDLRKKASIEACEIINAYTKRKDQTSKQEPQENLQKISRTYVHLRILGEEAGTIEFQTVERVNNLHINRSGNDSQSSMFRYEALAPEQCFSSFIAIDSDDKKLIEDIIDILKTSTYYLGGSKGSGYGRCSIDSESIHSTDKNPETSAFDMSNLKFKNIFYIWALSPVIARNEFGDYLAAPDSKYLENRLGLTDVQLVDSKMSPVTLLGFNRKWGISLPAMTAIGPGSVFLYQFKGPLEPEKVESLVNQGIGERREDGLGRILIVPNLAQTFTLAEKLPQEQKTRLVKADLSEDSKKQLKTIMERLIPIQFERYLLEDTLKFGFVDIKDCKLTSSQLGKLIDLANIARNSEPTEGLEIFNNYLNHISEMRSNQRVMRMFTDTKIDLTKHELFKKKLNVKDFLIEWMTQATVVDSFIEALGIDHLQVVGVDQDLTEQEVYRYNINRLTNILKFWRNQLGKL